MGIFSAFISSSSPSHPPPPPTNSPPASSEKEPPLGPPPSSGSAGRKVSPLNKKKSSGGLLGSSSSKSTPAPAVVASGSKLKGNGGGEGGGNKVNGGTTTEQPPAYTGSHHVHQPKLVPTTANGGEVRRDSRESGASGEFVVEGAVVQHTVTTTTTTTFFPLFRRKHHPPPPQLEPPLLSTAAQVALPPSPAVPSSSSFPSSSPPAPPSKPLPSSSSRAASQPHPTSRSTAVLHPLPHSPDLPLVPPNASTSRHASASAAIGGGSKRRLSSEEKGKGKGLPQLPGMEAKSLPKTPTRSRSPSPDAGGSKHEAGSRDLGMAGEKEGRAHEERADEGAEGESSSSTIEGGADTLQVVTSELKAFVHRGPARGASIVVTPSSPLLGATLEVPPDPDPGPFLPSTSSSSSSSSSSTTVPPSSTSSSPLSSTIHEDFTTPPTYPSPLPIPNERTAQQTLARRTSQMSLGHGFPSYTASPPPSSPPDLPTTLPPPPPSPIFEHEARSPSTFLGSTSSASSSLPPQRHDLPTSPPMLVPPTFTTSTSTSILSTSSPSSISYLPVSFGSSSSSSSNSNSKKPKLGRAKSHATLNDTTPRPSVVHSLSDSTQPPPSDLPASTSVQTKPATKRMSSMDIFASFTSSSNSSSSSSSTAAAAAGLDWRQRVKRRASASALGGTEREREKERARSKSGGGQPARFVVPPLPNASTSSLEPPPSLPSSTRSTPSGGKRLSLWARRGSTFDRIPPPATSTTSNTFSSTSEATSTTNNSSSAVSPVLSDVEDPDAALRSMQFTLPLFDLGKRFSFGEMGGKGVAGAGGGEERQEVLVDSPTAEEVMGLGLGLGVEEEEGGKESGRSRVDTTGGAGAGEAEGESTTAKGGAGFPIDSTPSSPHPFLGQPSPTHSSSSGRALVPLFEHHPTSAATSSTSSFPHEPYSTVSSSRSSTSIHNVGSIIPPSYGLPPPSPSSSIRSATLQRPSLSPMRSNSSGSTSVGGRIRESMFGISRPTAGRARSSSTLLGGSRSSNKPSDGLFGLMDNLRPPTGVGSPSSSSSLDPFGSISSTHSLSPNSPVISSSLSRSGSQHRHVVDEFGSAGFLSTDPSAAATRSSFSSSSPSRSNSIFRRPRSATSPPPADLLFPGNHSPSKSSSRSSRPMSIRRLSSALFDIGGSSNSNSNSLTASPSSSPNQTLRRDTSASLFPLPSRASSSSSILLSPSGRKSPSKRRESIASSVGSEVAEKERSNRPMADVPTREEEESPETWLRRLLEAVPKYEVANVLAVSGDEFHVAALRAYMSSFDFSGKPLDVALRRLLMEVALPRETQQIDRVMESFAKQYLEGNPGLFTNEDHPYILAFSLIMLHTDAFNKSNKNKMSKADYIKNTRLDGVLPEVLDTFFDNITFTPFVFVEDDDAVLGSQRTLPAESSLDPSSTTLFSTSQGGGGPSSGSSLLLGSKSTKVDVYYLISENLTQTLRADVQSHIPSEDPFSYHGGPGRTSFDTGEIHASFVAADIIEIGPPGGSGSGSSGGGGIGARKPSTGSLLLNATAAVVESKVQTLRLTKFGVLSRKEDLGDGGRKASNRKWRDWTVILTGSQLLFFKDPAWATVLQKQAEEQSSIAGSRRGSEASGRILLNKMSSFKPDEVLSVKDSIAITETSYNKYPNAFRFVMPHGRQYLLQAADEVELTEWMSRINYASAFKTASIRMRGMGMDSSQAQLAGAAAAASHARALRSEDVGSSRASSIKASSSAATGDFSTPSSSTTQLNVNPFAEAFGPAGPSSSKTNGNSTPSTSPRTTSSAPRSPLFTAPRLRSLSRPPPVDLESPIFSPEEDGEQLETAFMEIKAELAAGRGGATRLSTSTASEEHANRARAASVDASFLARSSFEKHHFSSRAGTNAVGVAGSPHASRSEALKFKVDSLQSKISATEMHLNAELRVARNLAVLTPFQRSTRDRIQLAVIPLAKKVRHLRMELARLRCYEEILRTDLQVETDAWKSMKSIAHQAAQNSLSGGSTQPKPSALGILPSLEISLHTGTTPPRREPIGIPRGAGHRSTSLRRSSIASFRSANENPSSSRSPSDDDDDDSTDPRPSHKLDAPSSSWPKPLGTPSPPTTLSRPSSPSPTPSLVEQQHHDEDLERPTDWKSTRAAKRVSLANVPESTVRRISLRLRKESLDDMRSRHRLLQVTPADGAAAEEDGGVEETPVVEESRSRSFRRRASVGRRAKSEDDGDSTREERKGLGFP